MFILLISQKPDAGSDIFQKSILINSNTTLKAVYCLENVCIGSVLEQEFTITKSTGKKITLAKEPHKNYNTGGAFTLVDGIVGRIPWYGKEWLGFSGDDLEAIIDLEKNQLIKSVKVGVFKCGDELDLFAKINRCIYFFKWNRF